MTGPVEMHVDTVDDLRGQFLCRGRYRVLELLGLGGPSEVWLALDTHLERQVAIKTLRADAGSSWAEITAHEARTLARIDHPHVVPIYDSFVERDKPWIVMKFIRGRTLADVLDTEGPLPEDKLWDVARAISSALAASHQAGIVHRDLKPANVMIGDDDTIWLVDFGIALHSHTGPTPWSTTPVGTLAYMAPECLSGRFGRSADLWSLGVLLLTLATGRNPFQRPDRTTTVGAILHAPIPDLPIPSLQPIARQLLNRTAERRPAAADVAAELNAGVPDRIPRAAGRLLRRRSSPARAEPPRVAPPSTRADSQLAYWGMSRVLDTRGTAAAQDARAPFTAPPRVVPAAAVPPPAVWPPAVWPPVVRPPAGPRPSVRPVMALLGGWGLQLLAAVAGLAVGAVCVAPLSMPVPPVLVAAATALTAVVATCLTAGSARASSGRWLTVTVGWAWTLAVCLSLALQLGPPVAVAVPIVALLLAVWLRRVYRDASMTDTAAHVAAVSTATAAVVAVAAGAGLANGILVLSGGPAAAPIVLVASWSATLVGISTVLGRRATRMQDLNTVGVGILAVLTESIVLAVGVDLWRAAFGADSAAWSATTSWSAYGSAAAVLMIGVGAQVRVGRAMRRGVDADRTTAGALGALLVGCLAGCVVGTAAGVAAMAATGQLILAPLLFVVPAVAGGYTAVRSASTPGGGGLLRGHYRLFGWMGGWSAVLAAALALLPLGLTPLLPGLDDADLALVAAICTVVLGACGALPAPRTFRWARRQTADAIARHAGRLALQVLCAAVGLAAGTIILGVVVDDASPTPPIVVVSVIVGALSVLVVDLARAGTAWSCALVLLGTAGVVVALGCAVPVVNGRAGPGSWSVLQHLGYLAMLISIGAGVVLLVRFAAELSRNLRGERDNHAFTALVLAGGAAAAVYGLLARVG